MTAIAVLELTRSAARWETWSALAWADTKSRYRRTTIGPFWMTLSTGAMVGSVGILYAGLFGSASHSICRSSAWGMIVWTFINTVITEGCNVFIAAAGYIKSVPLPLAVHVYRLLARNAIILAHNAVLVIVLWLTFRWSIGLDAAFATLGFLIALSRRCRRRADTWYLVRPLSRYPPDRYGDYAAVVPADAHHVDA